MDTLITEVEPPEVAELEVTNELEVTDVLDPVEVLEPLESDQTLEVMLEPPTVSLVSARV